MIVPTESKTFFIIVFNFLLFFAGNANADFLTHVTVQQVGLNYSYTLFNDEPKSSTYYATTFDITINAPVTIVDSPTGWSYFTDNLTYVDWYNTDPSLPYPHDVAPGSSLSGFIISSNVTTTALQVDTVTSWDHSIDNGGPGYQGYVLAPYAHASSTVPEPTSMIPLGIGMVTLAGYSIYRGRRDQ